MNHQTTGPERPKTVPDVLDAAARRIERQGHSKVEWTDRKESGPVGIDAAIYLEATGYLTGRGPAGTPSSSEADEAFRLASLAIDAVDAVVPSGPTDEVGIGESADSWERRRDVDGVEVVELLRFAAEKAREEQVDDETDQAWAEHEQAYRAGFVVTA